MKRRRVFRVLIGYGVLSFAVLQIIEPIMHGLHWPDSVLSYVVAALAVGFPISVVLAWAFDVNASGIERTAPSASPGLRGPRLALLLVGTGTLGAVPALAWYFLSRGASKPVVESAAAERPAPSIAVLPFSDLSPGKDQEYFSDGIAEEILNALSQVEGLQVAGRTSSFYFKGKSEDLATIGSKLHVATVLEGSVRKAGDRVRITAQLIDVKNGYHLWSNQYDRDLADIFQVQSDLAAAVVAALKVKLLPGSPRAIRVHPARDAEAHRLFLLGRSQLLEDTPEGLRSGEETLEKAAALEPTYSPTWQYITYVRTIRAFRAPPSQAEPQVRSALEAANQAIAGDPEDGGSFAARAWVRGAMLFDWAGAQDDINRALALAPDGVVTLHVNAILLAQMGKLKEAIASERRAVDLDPLASVNQSTLGYFLFQSGEYAAARDAYQRALEVAPASQSVQRLLGNLDLLEGHAEQALARFEKMAREPDRLMGVALALHDLNRGDGARRALDALAAIGPGDYAYRVALVHSWRGEADEAFRWLDRAFAQHDFELRSVKLEPFLRGLHSDLRYRALLEKLKLPLD